GLLRRRRKQYNELICKAMSTEKTNIEKFEDFELTPENAKKVEGGGHVVTFCREFEAVQCIRVEAKYCGKPAAADPIEVRAEDNPWK
ncbi:MAG: hypothetical protein IJQ64_05830, partial [Prevotella sp.]|nr:hypothetical protein [Prevotella sp.]